MKTKKILKLEEKKHQRGPVEEKQEKKPMKKRKPEEKKHQRGPVEGKQVKKPMKKCKSTKAGGEEELAWAYRRKQAKKPMKMRKPEEKKS